MRPDFIVIGAMKCGTSTVCAYLEEHADAFMVPNAEPNFFSHDDRYAKGTDWYEAYFEGWSGEPRCGEGSNNYSSGARFPQAAERMAAYNPDVKVVFIVRHPIERLISAWIQSRSDKGDKIPATVDRAILEQPEFFVDQSLYWRNISRYRAVFPDAQIFVGFMEDMKQSPAAFFDALCTFLEIPVAQGTEGGHKNPSAGKTIPSPLYSKIRQIPGVKLLSGLLPTSLKASVRKNFLSQKITTRPEISADVYDPLKAELEPDARAFLAQYGKPADFWRFE